MKVATTNPRYAIYRDDQLIDLVRVQDKKAISIKQSKINRRHTQSIHFKGTEPRLDSGCDFQLVTGDPSWPNWSKMVGIVAGAASRANKGKRHSKDLKRTVLDAYKSGSSIASIVKHYGIPRSTANRWVSA